MNDALLAFEQVDARAAKVVELKFFGGLENEEIAEVLGVSLATVKRDWAMRSSAFQRHCAAVRQLVRALPDPLNVKLPANVVLPKRRPGTMRTSMKRYCARSPTTTSTTSVPETPSHLFAAPSL